MGLFLDFECLSDITVGLNMIKRRPFALEGFDLTFYNNFAFSVMSIESNDSVAYNLVNNKK